MLAVPTFCRHNRLVQNCPICSKEQQIEMRAVVSSSAPAASRPRTPASTSNPGGATRRTSGPSSPGRGRGERGVRVRRLARGADDGFHSGLVPGLKSSEDAERLAEEIAFSATRLRLLADEPPGPYAEVAAGDDVDERTWLAFLIAYLGPVDGEEPFASIERARTTWSSGQEPAFEGITPGPRSAFDAAHPMRAVEAYRAWAGRAGSQAAAFTGEASWNPERRFARVFERLALPGFHRDARFELLVMLGRLGVYELRAGGLQFGGENEVTVAAKRSLGIGDPILLERRASDLAGECAIELDVLDVALHNWGRGQRSGFGIDVDAEPDPVVLDAVRDALGLG